MILLGIDGGGTKTRCLAADQSGRILAEGIAGPSNYLTVGRDAAAANVMAATEQALRASGATMADVVAVVAGLAAVGRPEDEAIMRAALTFPAGVRLQLVADARVALAGALAGQPGAVVIAGTGSIAYGVDAAGQTVRAGGWGWILGDEGSGYDIGRRAISGALAAHDGTGPESSLGARICEAWALEQIVQVVPLIHSDLAATKTRVASLVPVVMAAADEGDQVATAILAGAGRDLGLLAAGVLRRLALPEPLVAMAGGVLSSSPIVRDGLRARLAELLPNAAVIPSRGRSAEGAVWMAQQLAANGT